MTIELLVLTLLVFIASAMGTFSGFGTSTIMVPVMLLFFPLPVTHLFVGVIHWFGDIWKMMLFRSGIRQWRTILWFAVPGFFASYLGAAMSITVNEAILTRILGGFLLVVARSLDGKPFCRPSPTRAFPIVYCLVPCCCSSPVFVVSIIL